MKRVSLLLASFIVAAVAFGQNAIQKNNIQQPQLNQLIKAPIHPISDADRLAQYPKSPTGHIRCISPTTHESEEQFESWISQKIAEINLSNNYTAKASRNIPVVVHVLHNGDAVGSGENISVAQIQSQIDALNEDFSATNGDIGSVPGVFTGDVADSDIQFCLALTDPFGNATNGIDRINIGVASVSDTDIETNYGLNNMWDPTKYLNIFVGNLTGGLLGKAVFPTGSGLPGMPGGGAPAYDGVMCGATAFGRTGSAAAPFNLGRTATHEIGHWLGLRHIGGDTSGGCGDDYCADTPAQKGGTGAQGNGFGQNYGCPSHPLTYAGECSGTTAEMFMNYMDYVNDACMYMFTNDQKLRMDAVLSNSPQRMELLTSNRCQPPAITADFTADITTVNVGGSVNFTDLSVSPNTLNSWTWSFPGGTPNSHVGQTPPAITYSTAGQYNVTLTVGDVAAGSDVETKTNYINVINAAACDTLLNITATDTLSIYGDGATGFAAGWNQWAMPSHAEQYSGYSPYTVVTGLNAYFFGVTDGGNGASIDVNVWNDATGQPGTILGTINVSLTDLNAVLTGGQGVVEFMFDNAISVGAGPFYIGFDYNGFGTGDELGIVSNSVYDPTPNTAYCIFSGSWSAMSGLFGDPFSLYISPYVSLDAPTATINTDVTTVCQGGTVNFDATSSSNAISYSWVFNSGSPASSTNSTETVSYAAIGTPRAYLIANGNCGSIAVDSVDITVTAGNTVSAASSSPSVCVNTAMTNVTHTTTMATGIGTATGLPAGVTANWSGNTITISGTPTANGTFNYTIPLTGGCGTVNATGTITVTSGNTVSAASSSPTLCVNTAMTNVTHTTTGATGIGTATGLPAGVTANWSGNTITISGTPTANGTFNYTIPLTGGCGTVNATGTITVNAANTVSAASSSPTLCVNTAMTNVTHTTTGATGIGTATGLPAGVTANWSGNTITISGTPTANGTFNYTIPLTGGCGTVNATGTITVNAANTVSAASSSPSVCVNTAITNVTHTTTGATGIGTASGLPAGVTANWSGNTITISGTPTANGTFNYTIPLTGGCGSVNATGTITVTSGNTVSAASSSPTLCVNTAMTNVTHTTTGATGIGTATGLPAGVTANWSGNTITISGTPTADGTFNYTIPLTGGCGTVNATGTITVNAQDNATMSYPQATYCITDGDAIPTITGDAGSFASSPVGLSIDGVTGVIGVSASTAGNYTVTYTTSGACPVAVNTSVEIDMCTGIAENVNSTVKIFPNPAISMLTIESVNQDINQIRLVNILGETVISKNTQSTRTIVNVEQLSTGVYFIQLFDQSGEIVMTRKVSIK